MRNIPGLSADIANRAITLAAKARDARQAAPGAAPPRASIAPAKVNDGVATLRLYDYIEHEGGYWGISADEFADALDSIEGPVTRIDLRVNSGGGSVWDGLAMLNQLRTREEPIRAIIDGVAASAASFIAAACDEVVMMPNSKMMIHNAMGICMGQAVDMREYADFLEDSSRNIAEIYAARTDVSTDEWCTLMDSVGLMGKWYAAQEAVDAGLADSVWESSKSDDAAPEDKAPKAKADEAPTDVEAVTFDAAAEGAARIAKFGDRIAKRAASRAA